MSKYFTSAHIVSNRRYVAYWLYCGIRVVVVVVIVVGVCNHCQMRTSKCTCLIFGVSIGLDPG